MTLRPALALIAALALCACASGAHQRKVARGHDLAQANCSSCHAIGRSGDSPAPEAPPFRTLSQNYRVADLEEALAEGISVGHPAMPNFAFAPEDAEALIAYLQTIQDESPR